MDSINCASMPEIKQNGCYHTFRENKQLYTTVNYRNSQIHGLYQIFHKNGQVFWSITFENGLKHGLCQSFNENGQLYLTYNYVNDKQHGLETTFYGSNIHSTEEYKNGILVTQSLVFIQNDKKIDCCSICRQKYNYSFEISRHEESCNQCKNMWLFIPKDKETKEIEQPNIEEIAPIEQIKAITKINSKTCNICNQSYIKRHCNICHTSYSSSHIESTCQRFKLAYDKEQQNIIIHESQQKEIKTSNININLCTKGCGRQFTTKGGCTRHSNQCPGPQ